MNPILAFFAFLFAGVFSVSAQGTFTFNNSEATTITNALTGLGAVGAKVGAYYSTVTNYASDQNSSFLLPIPTAVTNTVTPGRFIGGRRDIPGVAEGSYVALQIRAWTGAYASYEDAYLGALGGDASVLLGGSRVFLIGPLGSPAGASGGTPPPSIFGAQKLTSFYINTVPEPSTFALAALGAAILFGCHRFGRRGAGDFP